MRVALFITCFNDTLFPNVGIATTHLLERLGLTVDWFTATFGESACLLTDASRKNAPMRGKKRFGPVSGG